MDFLELAKNRYTTKKYDPAQNIPADKIEKLKEILRLSPSSINSQPWKFTFVTDPEMKAQLAKVSNYNEPKIVNGGLLVVFSVIDDLNIFEKQLENHLSEHSVNYYKTHIKHRPEQDIKAWMAHQVYISLGVFLSAAASLELDSTAMEGIQTLAYDEILGIKGYKTLFAVCVGFRHPEDPNQISETPKRRLPSEDVIVSI